MTTEAVPDNVPERYGKYLRRLGLWVLALGFLIALVAAAILGRQITAMEPTAIAIHRGALLVMLAGFLLVLSSSRVAQIFQMLQRYDLPEKNDLPEEARMAHSTEATECSVRRPFYRLELLLVGCLMTGSTLAVLLPIVSGALLTVVMAMLIPGVLTVLIVYTKGWRRAFCLGAIVPAAAVALLATLCMLFVVSSSTSVDYGYSSRGAHLRYLVGFRTCALGGWFLMLISGTLASLLALLLHLRDRGTGAKNG